jgi:hypothetical protein
MFWKLFVTFFTACLLVFFISKPESGRSENNLNRIPSSQSSFNQNLQTSISKVLKIQSATEVDNVLNTIKTQLISQKSQSLDDRIILEIIDIVLAHKGFITRLLPLIESNDVVSVMSTSLLKSIKQNISSETPWLNHLFDYLFLEINQVSQFKNMSDVQSHFIQNLAPRTLTLIALLDELETKDVTLDLGEIAPEKFNHLPVAYKNYKFSQEHFLMVKSHLQTFLAWGHYFSSYQMDDVLEIAEKVVKNSSRKTLLTQMGKHHPIEKSNLLSLADIHRVISQSRYSRFLTLSDVGSLAKSRHYLIQSLQSQLKLQNNFNKKLISAKDINFLRNEIKLLSSNDVQTVLHPLNGELVSINPSKIWSNHQNDLKKYFPTTFYAQKTKLVAQTKMIDLDYGKAIGWADPTFGGVLLNTNDNNLRTMTEGLLINPSTGFIGLWLKAFQ